LTLFTSLVLIGEEGYFSGIKLIIFFLLKYALIIGHCGVMKLYRRKIIARYISHIEHYYLKAMIGDRLLYMHHDLILLDIMYPDIGNTDK
jgi:hypothetical protein